MKAAAMNLSNRATSGPSANLFAVVMAGGSGTRLWPESRNSRPKPFLTLSTDGRTLFEATLDRLDGIVSSDARFVVVGRRFAKLVAESKPRVPINPALVLLEPKGRDTALCVAWAAFEALQIDPDPTLIATPSDSWINSDDSFRESLAKAVRLVADDPERLVTIGIRPTSRSTEYGYIRFGAEILDEQGAYEVLKFGEKPDEDKVEEFLKTGCAFWNAGVGIWKARRYLELLRDLHPAIATTLDQIERIVAKNAASGTRTEDDPEFVDAFTSVADKNAISFDYAVLQKAPKVCVVSGDAFEWSDVGSFSALARLGIPSPSPVETVVHNATGNYVRVASGANAGVKVVALAGVDDLVVVVAGDALLIAKKGDDAAIRKVVEGLREQNLDAFL